MAQQGYQWAYIFSAIRPATGEDFTLVLPLVNAEVMDLFLARFAATLAIRLGGEGVPGAAAGLDDRLGVGEEAQRQEALAQIEPDPLDRVELRAVVRQRHEGEVVGDGQRALVVPAGAVESYPWLTKVAS